MDHGDPAAAEYGAWLAAELGGIVKQALAKLAPAQLRFKTTPSR